MSPFITKPMTTLSRMQAMLPGSQLLHIAPEDAKTLSISRVSSDSRKVQAGELFISLVGDRFDAHDFWMMWKVRALVLHLFPV